MTTWAFQIGDAPGSPTVPFPPLSHFVVGSGPHAAVRLEQLAPSHLEVTVTASGQASVKAVSGSTVLMNGTAINEATVENGTHLQVGPLHLVVQRGPDEPALEATAQRLTPFGTPPVQLVNEAPASARLVLPTGTMVAGRYRVMQKLAAGGMGEVYRVEHVELHKPFALKVMLPTLSNDADFVNRFKREAISASRIGQLNIVDISDFGQTEDGRFYFVMEYLDGLTLASMVLRQGALPIHRAVTIGLQTARALAAAHAQGIVHRDMKPENVMVLQRPGQPDLVKVLDFGVAKVSTGPGTGGQTQLGVVVGTPQYMSPEQAMGLAVDTRTDAYALGLILYEMLTGTPTFAGDTASILMVKQVTEIPPEWPEALASKAPAQLHELVFTLLEKDPNRRPVDLVGVVRSLEQLEAQLRLETPLAPATQSGLYRHAATPHRSSAVRISATGQTLPVGLSGSMPAVRPASSPPTRPARWPAVVVALAAGAVLVTGSAAYLLRPAPQLPGPVTTPPLVLPQVTPTLEPLPAEVASPREVAVIRYRLTSEPTGAEVFEADVSLGLTPVVIQRPADVLLNLTFALKGYTPINRKLKVPSADGEYSVEMEPEKKPKKLNRQPRDRDDRDQPDELKGLDDP